MTARKRIFRILLFIGIMIIALYMVTPVYILLKISISEPREVLTQHPSFLI